MTNIKNIVIYLIAASSFLAAACDNVYWGKFVKVADVTLDKDEIQLPVGETQKLTATVHPDNATEKTVYWYSSDNGVATVDRDGNVTGVATGLAFILVASKEGGDYRYTYYYDGDYYYAYPKASICEVRVRPSDRTKAWVIIDNRVNDREFRFRLTDELDREIISENINNQYYSYEGERQWVFKDFEIPPGNYNPWTSVNWSNWTAYRSYDFQAGNRYTVTISLNIRNDFVVTVSNDGPF